MLAMALVVAIAACSAFDRGGDDLGFVGKFVLVVQMPDVPLLTTDGQSSQQERDNQRLNHCRLSGSANLMTASQLACKETAASQAEN